MGLIRHIPNTITLLNLLCGSLAVIFALKGKSELSVTLILIATLFDFLDGLSARLLNAYSSIGKELDSLADVVSFGLAPSILLFELYSKVIYGINLEAAKEVNQVVAYLPLVVVLASAVRLAIFNVDTRQTEGFMGLPTPASALLIISFIHYIQHSSAINTLYINLFFIPALSFLLSYLMVSQIPMFSLKTSSLRFKENKRRYIFALLSLGLAIVVAALGERWSLWLLLTLTLYTLYNIAIFLVMRVRTIGNR